MTMGGADTQQGASRILTALLESRTGQTLSEGFIGGVGNSVTQNSGLGGEGMAFYKSRKKGMQL